jgi:predicted O-linked N-acetylglucosamine transferase (SPINDLY family)
MSPSILNITRLIEQGRADLAAIEASKARAATPQDAELCRLHGVALLSIGQIPAAIDALQASRALNPHSIETLCNLGSAELARDNAVAALSALETAAQLAPKHPAVLNGLGNARRASGDLTRARDAYLAATQAAPNHVGAWLNLAAIELALHRPEITEQIARSISAQLAHPQAFMLLGQALSALQRPKEAAQALERARQLDPRDSRLAYQLGVLADDERRYEDAAIAHAQAYALDPQMHEALAQLVFTRRQVCDWRDLESLSNRLRAAVRDGAPGITPFGFLAESATAAEQLRCAQNFANGLLKSLPASMRNGIFTHRRRARGEPLRIGFASNGFGNHPTGLLTVAMFEALRELGIEFHLFATTREDGKEIEQRLKAAASAWHCLAGLSPRAMAERIHASGIEILVDLRVWGGGNISEALALKPAPIQINWLAYPGTSGASWIDYVIADRMALPSSLRDHYSENVAYLPRCFQPSDPTRMIAEPPSRADCGLPESGVVYVCFNNSYKLDPRSVQRMCKILYAVQYSVLWLLEGPGQSNERLRTIVREHGIDPARLVFMKKLPHADYLSRYRHADLFLDTAAYNAHTTASDAFWAGCPVLTTAGETFASRVAASLAQHLGMPELIAADDDAYVNFATGIGRDKSARDALRERVAERRRESGLFNMRAFARDFLSLLETMADRHRRELSPAVLD